MFVYVYHPIQAHGAVDSKLVVLFSAVYDYFSIPWDII